MRLFILILMLCGVAQAGAPATQPNDMVMIPGGTFKMGTDEGFPFEGPVHEVSVKAFWMEKHEVTVEAFEKFIVATKYKTEAEKFGWSGVFDPKQGQWTKCDGADWKHPTGPESKAEPKHPVVHVSYADAQAYAKWAGKRLPTEAEFEFAARGGKDQKFAWGNELYPGGKCMANAWQGMFPMEDQGKDGFKGLAPVGSFPANAYGLLDITGNVWEWSSDWFDPEYYQHSPKENPTGPAQGTERVLRGGSWLCAENYCLGYRVAARNKTAPDSGLNNLGFRCVRDP